MVERINHALLKIDIAGHADGADNAVHPLRQTIFKQSKVMAVQLWRIWLFQLAGVDGGNDGVAVVFVQTWHLQWLMRQVCALGDALPRLRVAAQRAGEDGVKLQVFLLEVRPQLLRLLVAQRAQVVVVFRAKRGLAVAD